MSSIRFTTHDEPQPEQRSLLNELLWGSPGGLRYQNLHETDWRRLPAGSRSILAHRGDVVLGTYVLAPQSWGILRLLLAVRADAQGTGAGKALVQHAAEKHTEEVLAGTIERTNHRSLKISLEAGYKVVGELENVTFTRYRPRASPTYRPARPDEIPAIENFLRAQAHGWFSAEHLRAEEILVTPDLSAGIQICEHTWKIPSLGMPAPIDGAVQRALPFLGITPSRFPFATGHYWWGDPGEWGPLMEHALALHGLQAIVLTGDVTSKLWSDLRGSIQRGFVGTLLGGDGMVITSKHGLEAPVHFTPLNAV